MERLTERDSNGTNFLVCREGCNGGPACFECEQKAIDRLAAYEDFVEQWKLTSIEDASRIFRRINALGGTDLMGQYRDLGPINHLRSLVQAEKDGRLVVLPPNDPLTLEELREMDEEPVWEELGEAIQAVMEVKEAFGCAITQDQAWKIDRMIRKCGELIKAAQKVRRAMNGTTPVSLDDAVVHLSEECADIAVCIDALIESGLIEEDKIQSIGRYKNDQWHGRVCGS